MSISASSEGNYSFLKMFNSAWKTLVGSPANFALESRIFHSISICLITIMVKYIPYNFSIGLYISAISVFILATVFVIQFYYSRFHAHMHNSALFGLAGIVIFSVNYFTNSGINGSTDLIWPS